MLIRAPSKGQFSPVMISSWIYPSTEPLEKGENKQPFRNNRIENNNNRDKIVIFKNGFLYLILSVALSDFVVDDDNDINLLI